MNLGNLTDLPKNETSKFAEALAIGTLDSSKANSVDFGSFIPKDTFSKDKLISGLSDSEIVERIKSGDSKAFDVIDHKYRQNMLLYANYMLKNFDIRDSREASKDIVQDTFANFIHMVKIGRFFSSGNVKSYLKASIYKNSQNYMRENSAKKLPKFFNDFETEKVCNYSGNSETANKISDNFATLESTDTFKDLAEMIDFFKFKELMIDLKPHVRDILELRYIEGKTQKQIAKKLDISVRRVEYFARVGNKEMKKILEKYLF
jgi:RNA polymerase sigma factor (sigma-70 family)